MSNWTDHKPTIEWLKGQPIWHTKELVVVGILCLVIGFCVGFAT